MKSGGLSGTPHKKHSLHENLSFNERASTAHTQHFDSADSFDKKIIKKRPKPPMLEQDLSLDQGKKLLEKWKATSFADFNIWVQMAKAKLEVEIKEVLSTTPWKMFHCNIILELPNDSEQFFGHGAGKSKKIAKCAAIEAVLIDLIETGKIKMGLKSNIQKSLKAENPNQIQKQMFSQQLSKKVKLGNIYNLVSHLSVRISDYLREDFFEEALECLRQINVQKDCDWEDVTDDYLFPIFISKLLI